MTKIQRDAAIGFVILAGNITLGMLAAWQHEHFGMILCAVVALVVGDGLRNNGKRQGMEDVMHL
jgi:asparagine N-glycosylation enzyme membrane subunit Stt3